MSIASEASSLLRGAHSSPSRSDGTHVATTRTGAQTFSADMGNEASQEDKAKALEQLDELIDNNDVVVLSKSWCPYCQATKDTLAAFKASPKVLEIDQRSDGPALQAAVAEKEGHTTVPAIWIRGEFIGGNSDLEALEDAGELEAKLAGSG